MRLGLRLVMTRGWDHMLLVDCPWLDPPEVDTWHADGIWHAGYLLGINLCGREWEAGNLNYFLSQCNKGSLNPTGSSEAHMAPVFPFGWTTMAEPLYPHHNQSLMWEAPEACALGWGIFAAEASDSWRPDSPPLKSGLSTSTTQVESFWGASIFKWL